MEILANMVSDPNIGHSSSAMERRTRAGMEPIRLLLLDDHVLFRESLGRLLSSEPDFEVVAQCGTSAEAREMLQSMRASMMLLDFNLENDRGGQLISEVRGAGYQGTILIVTAGMTAAESLKALHAGASGIFFKHNSPETLIKVIRLVAGGEVWLDQKIVQLLAEDAHQQESQHLRKIPGENARNSLTEREQEVLRGIFEGLTNRTIATRIGVSEGSVKATVQQLFQKTRVRTRSQLVRVALEGAITRPPNQAR
jgi:DNA-binding NarL/FixJ family response regulator